MKISIRVHDHDITLPLRFTIIDATDELMSDVIIDCELCSKVFGIRSGEWDVTIWICFYQLSNYLLDVDFKRVGPTLSLRRRKFKILLLHIRGIIIDPGNDLAGFKEIG